MKWTLLNKMKFLLEQDFWVEHTLCFCFHRLLTGTYYTWALLNYLYVVYVSGAVGGQVETTIF